MTMQIRVLDHLVRHWARQRTVWAFGHEFDAVHASPPCQAYSSAFNLPTAGEHPRLLAPTIARLRRLALPWVVENVGGARRDFPADVYRFQLCATAFGLPMWRHRWFASSEHIPALSCQHQTVPDGELVGVYGASDGAHSPGFKHPGDRRGPRQATTEHIGGYLMAALSAKAAA